MPSPLTLTLLTLLPLALALPQQPTPPTISLRITNDQTGAGANALIPTDNLARPVSTLYANTPISAGGSVVGTSAQLVQFTDGTQCQFNVQGGGVIQLDGRARNFAELDGDSTVAMPVVLDGWTVQCGA